MNPTQILPMLKTAVEYLGARMTVALIAVAQAPIIIYLTGSGVLTFDGELVGAAVVLGSLAMGAGVAIAAIIGRTKTDRMGKMPPGAAIVVPDDAMAIADLRPDAARELAQAELNARLAEADRRQYEAKAGVPVSAGIRPTPDPSDPPPSRPKLS